MNDFLNRDEAHAPPTSGKMPEARLWLRVLHEAIRESLKDPKRETWVGRFPSADFQEVCRLAGVDADYLWPRVRYLVYEAPSQERAKVYREMFESNRPNERKKDPAPKGEVELSTNGYHKPRAYEV